MALEGSHLGELGAHLGDMVHTIDFSLANWAMHEGEGDALGAPTMTHDLSDAVSVENVATFELHTRLFAKSTRLAHGADVILVKLLLLSALGLKTRQVLTFTVATLAGVTTAMLLSTEGDRGERPGVWYSGNASESHFDVIVEIVSFHWLCVLVSLNVFRKVLVFSDEIWLWNLPF